MRRADIIMRLVNLGFTSGQINKLMELIDEIRKPDRTGAERARRYRARKRHSDERDAKNLPAKTISAGEMKS